eukprot:6177586-Pleurochrysis_carterae.AAC.3
MPAHIGSPIASSSSSVPRRTSARRLSGSGTSAFVSACASAESRIRNADALSRKQRSALEEASQAQKHGLASGSTPAS